MLQTLTTEDNSQSEQTISKQEEQSFEFEPTLSFAEKQLKFTIEVIDEELQKLEEKEQQINKLSQVAYQAKVGLIGHRLEALKSLAKIAFDKQKIQKQEDAVGYADITELLVKGKK